MFNMNLYQKSPSLFKPLLKPLSWRGRASRKEFWLFQITALVFFVVWKFCLHPETVMPKIAVNAWAVHFALCELAVMIRRLHDADFAGWWVLLCFAFISVGYPFGPLIATAAFYLFFMTRKGTDGANRYGEPPGREVSDDGKTLALLLRRLMGVLTGGSAVYIVIGSVVLHGYTVYLSATRVGFGAAVASFILPLFSECYWFVKMMEAEGLANGYTYLILGYIVSFIILFVASVIPPRRRG